jgi:hypothetical protein
MSEPELRALAKLAGTDPELVDQFLGDGVSDFLKARSNVRWAPRPAPGVAASPKTSSASAPITVSAAKRIANMKLRRTVEPELNSLAESRPEAAGYWKDHLKYVTTPQQDYNFVREAVFHIFLGGPNVMSAAST